MRAVIVVGLVLLGPLASAQTAPLETYLAYSGTATVRHGSDFLYGERHVLHFRDGQLTERVVLYTCRNGAAFARKTVHYIDPLAPDFVLEDVSTGMREGLESRPSGRAVFFRADRADAERRHEIAVERGLVVDAGFDQFVRDEWDALMSGRTATMRFLVPSRLRDISFDVEHLRSDRFGDIPVEVFRLKLSGFWGWFLPGIDVDYSRADHVLVHYDGLSDLRDKSNANYQAEITFPLDDRKVADAQALHVLLETQLEACK